MKTRVSLKYFVNACGLTASSWLKNIFSLAGIGKEKFKIILPGLFQLLKWHLKVSLCLVFRRRVSGQERFFWQRFYSRPIGPDVLQSSVFKIKEH